MSLATWSSADVASPKAIAALLELDEHTRLNRLAALFLLVLPIAAASLLLFDGNPIATRILAAMLGVGFVATAGQYYLTSGGRFRLNTIAVLVALQMLAILAAELYFGMFSGAALLPVFITLFAGLGNYALLGFMTWVVSAVGRAVFITLIVMGVITDPGLIVADHLNHVQLIAIEALVQSLMAIAFIAGRFAHKSTASKLTWMLDGVRAAARRELEIASRLQTSILPRDIIVPAFEVSASMIPATEVGGDYYDVHATEDGCWIGIGDVSGHGLDAGLVMLMVQTSVASLTLDTTSSPSTLVTQLNRVIHGNLRRLGSTDYVTFSLLRLRRDGYVVAAGRHEIILWHSVETGTCQIVDTAGVWLGIRPMIDAPPTELTLRPGDTLVLHTDGVTEAANAQRQRFGDDRLIAAVTRYAHLPVAEMRAAIEREVTEFTAHQTDDVTLVVVRFVP